MLNAILLVSLVAAFFGSAAAGPLSGGYAPHCEEIRLQGTTLSAECTTSNYETFQSSVNLNSCVGASSGKLGYSASGGFASACDLASCQLIGEEYLTCNCKATNGQTVQSQYDLNQCVGMANGKLVC
ncbi:hypothetical protein HGRIS_000021 [Hohenbuehelia grisea]|uniref:Cyanovirin-N domain-containing protein n=1 Tax=Hohenbuehelia grisea TaxID=104357 RepID=A0ABR3JRY5_9AGAR